jgi:hypothetical protein
MKNKNFVFSMLLIGLFVLSSHGNVKVTAQESFVEENFSLWLYTQAGSPTREGMSFYLKQAVAPLGIKIKVVAKPFGQFVGDLMHTSSVHLILDSLALPR